MPDQTFFYFPATTNIGEEFLVDSDEYNHIVKSLRKTVGDPVDIVDGNGRILHARISEINKKSLRCQTQSIEQSSNELPFRVTAAVALIKQQRFEWMAEKLTELGVSKIQPLLTQRVVRSGFRKKRIEKKVISAMKQSERAVLPEITEPMEFSRWIELAEPDRTFLSAQSAEQIRLSEYHAAFDKAITFTIGPEGGWSESELHLMSERGIKTYQLGNRRLRTETAAIASLAEIAAKFEGNATIRRNHHE